MRALVMIVTGAALLVLGYYSVPPPENVDLAHVLFWIVVTLIASGQPVYLPRGVNVSVNSAPLIAALFDAALPRPFAPLWIALIGTLQLRDVRRELPLYGTLYNRATFVLAVFAGWLAIEATGGPLVSADPFALVPQLFLAGLAYSLVNQIIASAAASLRTTTPFRRVWTASFRQVWTGLVALVPMGWLMAEVAGKVGLWAGGLFMVPLLLARYSFSKYAETRDLFFGSVSALSQAIDAKDGFTRGHADRVSRIAGAVARDMGLSEREIEQIELAALLHDIGKIGVEDRILMKPARLDPDETELMRRHPIYGASILEPSSALRPLVPIVLAHHEHYDGSGYPQGLKAGAIPLGARIILVSDAYEAMTSDRIYRKAIGHEKAMEQLHKYKGIQFDPNVVRAIDQLLQKRGPQAFEVSDLPVLEYETLAELRHRLTHPRTFDAHAG
jgi:HD-GYP domain-containing protein (c-di-GMP phosphodiesterase class II)